MAKKNWDSLDLIKGLWILAIPIGIISLALMYVFLALDVIPDGLPFVGYIDDAMAILVAIWIAYWIKKQWRGRR